MQEEKVCNSAHFVTLTYENCPRSKNNFRTLNYVDLQLFFKRLRKLSNAKIRYYAVGEYGGNTMRPHYHIILFNATPENVIRAWARDGKPIGHTHFGGVSGASIGYTLKYIAKSGKIPMHKNDDRLKERALMSKGIGKNYLSQAVIAWHKADITKRVYVPLPGGKKRQWPDTIRRNYTIQKKKGFWPDTSRMKRFTNRLPISMLKLRYPGTKVRFVEWPFKQPKEINYKIPQTLDFERIKYLYFCNQGLKNLN